MTLLAIDLEFTEDGELLMFQYKFPNKPAQYIMYPKKEQIQEIVKGHHILGYNIVGDLKLIGLTGRNLYEVVNDVDDLYLMAKVKLYHRFYDFEKLNPQEKKKAGVWSLEGVLRHFGVNLQFDKKTMQKRFAKGERITQDMIEYALSDVEYLHFLYEKLSSVKDNIVYRLDKAMIPVVLDAMIQGIPFNMEATGKWLADIERQIQELGEFDFNPNSPQQVKAKLGSTDAQAKTLKYLWLSGNELAGKILKFKALDKARSTLNKYVKQVRDYRLYGNFDITQAQGGRMSCYKENLQQIPRIFKPLIGYSEGDDRYLVKLDFPAIELRIATILFKEPTMIKLFQEGVDLHTYSAQKIYRKEEITKKERQIAKSANFGLLYGMSAPTLREYIMTMAEILISEDEAHKLRQEWLNLYSGFMVWHNKTKNKLKYIGFVEDKTILGRTYKTGKFTVALNQKIQGTGAELLKLVAVRSYRKGVNIINLVHDEIVAEAPDLNTAKEYAKILEETTVNTWNEVFCGYTGIDIPIPVEAKIGRNWAEVD